MSTICPEFQKGGGKSANIEREEQRESEDPRGVNHQEQNFQPDVEGEGIGAQPEVLRLGPKNFQPDVLPRKERTFKK